MNFIGRTFTGLAIILIVSMLVGCAASPEIETPTLTPTATKVPIPTSTQPPTPTEVISDEASSASPNWDEFELLAAIKIDTDKVAIDQMIANILGNDPLDPCPVVHKVAEGVGTDNPTYLVYISAAPDDFFMVVIHTVDSDSEPYGSAVFGAIVEGVGNNVIVPAEYPLPEGQDAPDEFEIQVIMPGCDMFNEKVTYQNSSTASPFLGEWFSIDSGDGSTRKLSISETDGIVNVIFSDTVQASCGLDKNGKTIASTGTGEGTVFFNLLQVEIPLYCMTDPQSLLTTVHANIVYVSDNDTLDDGMVIWNRSDKVETYPLVFRDDFDKAINPDWTWIRVEDSQWSMTKSPGFLNVQLTHTYNAFEGGPDTLLLQWIKEENFEIVTRVFFEPKRNFQRVGLVIYENRENFVGLGRGYADVVDYPGNAIYFDNIYPSAPNYGDPDYANYPTPINNPSEVYLKLRRDGDTYTGFYSLDGQTWTLVGTHISPIKPVSYGLLIGYSDQPITAEFDFFELYSIP